MPLFAEARSNLSDHNDVWLAGLLGPASRVALVAVGGYGRREMLPGSDLDVLLLYEGQDGIAAVADRVWYPVWDSGVGLDHAVRTVAQARKVAREDLKAALGLLSARHVAGDENLTQALRRGVLADWRADAPTRLVAVREQCQERAAQFGELAFLLEPDLKEARGGLRDVHAIAAVAAAWVAPAPGPRVRAAYEQVLDARHALHELTGRGLDRLVLEEQDAVAARLGMLDGDVLLRTLAGAARTISYATDQALRQVDRLGVGRPRRFGVTARFGRSSGPSQAPPGGRSSPSPFREPLADGIVVQDGEVMLARGATPEQDPVLLLRAAAAAAQAGLPL